jgi:HxlR-like helix-turn-helix
VVGERWTLLIVRELLTGPKRFRIGTGLLAARLKFLAARGIIQRITLPPPGGTPAYELTEAGRAPEQTWTGDRSSKDRRVSVGLVVSAALHTLRPPHSRRPPLQMLGRCASGG